MPVDGYGTSLLHDTEFYVTLLMASFAILFGTRHIDASEHHEGMVAAIAFESLVKLVAFLAVGLYSSPSGLQWLRRHFRARRGRSADA